MRPILLEMDGFASFRKAISVSFEDADYFVLVGATGSGKSTIIDAITFALYGSVPRWDKENVVAPALAPSATRGTVKLVFDAKGTRYVAMREVRRNGSTGQVSIRTARLEKLLDPEALGALEDETEVLASQKDVKAEVEKLLGLDFNQFTKCVALPQGDVAEFLHAPASDRQKILTKLLGIEIYAKIGQAANARAAHQATRAETLEGSIGEYLAGESVTLGMAQERVRVVGELEVEVAKALPGIVTASAELQAAAVLVTKLGGACQTLDSAQVPEGSLELEERRHIAQSELTAAEIGVQGAEDLDTASRDALTAAPKRSELERVAGLHKRREAAERAVPNLQQQAKQAQGEVEAALAAAIASATSLQTVEAALDQALAREQKASKLASASSELVDVLTAVAAPAGLDELDVARRGLQAQKQAAAAALLEAQRNLTTAQAKRDRALDLVALERARTSLMAVCEGAQSTGQLAANAAELLAARDEDASAAEAAELAWEQANAALESAKAADSALALRPHLAVGEACPVCEQTVTDLPPHGDAADIDACTERLRTADAQRQQMRGRAQTSLRKASAGEQEATSALADLVKDNNEAKGAVVALDLGWTLSEPGDASAAALAHVLAEATAHLSSIQECITQSETAARTCREAETALSGSQAAVVTQENEARQAEGEEARLRAVLRTTADALVPLGRPQLDVDEPVTGWGALLTWVATELASRTSSQKALDTAASGATNARIKVQQTAEKAEMTKGTDEATHRAAIAHASEASTKYTAGQELLSELDAELAEQDVEAEITLALETLTLLEVAAKDAGDALGKARLAKKAAEKASAELDSELALARTLWATVRDALVPFGAPPAAQESIAGCWTSLVQWAQEQRHEREVQLVELSDRAEQNATALAVAEDSLRAKCLRYGVEGPDTSMTKWVAVALAREHSAATASVSQIQHAQSKVVELQAQADAAKTEAQVAGRLAGLLRVDALPRWLTANALQVLVAAASETLLNLSAGQFELTSDDSGFLVIDRHDTDSIRGVKTLSGGETFQAALALALALSSQLGALSASASAQLEAIFIDEGFGTLDEASLEIVASTLEELASSGGRMVGLITHVPALADRVPVRFHVKRDSTGSHVARQGS